MARFIASQRGGALRPIPAAKAATFICLVASLSATVAWGINTTAVAGAGGASWTLEAWSLAAAALTHKPGTERFAKSAHAPKGVVTAAVADVLLPGLSDELAAASTDTSEPASSAHIYAPPRWLREEVRALFGLLPIAWTKSNNFSFMNTKYCEFYASESSRQPLKLSTHPPHCCAQVPFAQNDVAIGLFSPSTTHASDVRLDFVALWSDAHLLFFTIFYS